MNENTQKIVVIGATSSIAEHCARLWAAHQLRELVLVGRDLAKTELVAVDLRVRAPGANVTSLSVDFHDPLRIQAFADAVCASGPVDIVLIAHGSLPEQGQCQRDLQECREALAVNAVSPVLFAEAFAGHMEKAGRGTLALIGSVAGDRGRKSNYVYGAAKGLVTRYAQGLQHRFAGTALQVVLIKPGPTETPMTAHLKAQGARLASVESVAGEIVAGIAKGKPVIYTPGKWALIMMIIRHLPRFIFNKMDI
jgi:short-subunit dehydrogenase